MSLHLVALTGADDRVSIDALSEFCARHPRAELAILYFPEKEGSSRNPSAAWRERLLARGLKHVAAHLCGEEVFRKLLEPSTAAEILKDISRYSRVQVNINARRQTFTQEEVLQVYRVLVRAGINVIVQLHDESQATIKKLFDAHPYGEPAPVSVLFDKSRGKGIAPSHWPEPLEVDFLLFTGFAGGLGPDNIATELPKIKHVAYLNGPRSFWIDMETGLQTDNCFDLGKAERVMDAVKGEPA